MSEGDTVGHGQVIGEVGTTGRTKSPHLHFELWRGDVVHDPKRFLDAKACDR